MLLAKSSLSPKVTNIFDYSILDQTCPSLTVDFVKWIYKAVYSVPKQTNGINVYNYSGDMMNE